MDWNTLYRQRLCTAEEAVNKIKSGDRVLLANAAGEPFGLVEAMVKNKAHYGHITVCHMVTVGSGAYSYPENSDVFTCESWFASAPTRECLERGEGRFVPVHLHQVPRYIREQILPIDVMLVSVSRPDENGYVSTGVSADFTVQGIKSAQTVLAEVNDQMPVTGGDSKIHVKEIDAFVEVSRPLPEIAPPAMGEAEETIGRYCASLIPDGATLQIGIGAVPDAVLSQLRGKRHLGIHSEMISDGVVDLVRCGAVDNSRKSIDRGKIVTSFLMGTKKLYDFADRNPNLELRTAEYVNSPVVIAQNRQMVSLNSCIQADLFGQVASDMIGRRQFSGAGGQVDFIRGVNMALDRKGISIIAIPSAVLCSDGTMISKIVGDLPAGTAVTTTRQDVDYIVTEYGIARMRGQPVRDRARALIRIAHPNFREMLIEDFFQKFHTRYEALK